VGGKPFQVLPLFPLACASPPGYYISSDDQASGAGNELQWSDVIPRGKAGQETRRHCSFCPRKKGKIGIKKIGGEKGNVLETVWVQREELV